MKPLLVLLIAVLFVGTAWGQDAQSLDDTLGHWATGWLPCYHRSDKILIGLWIYETGEACITLGDSTGALLWGNIELAIETSCVGGEVYIIEFVSRDDWAKNPLRLGIYAPQPNRKNVTGEFLQRGQNDRE